MSRHVISVLVDNQSGVLSRVAGLFSRRGYNIDSLSVGETENSQFSRMTIVVRGDDSTLEQIKKQLNKLIDVIKVVSLTSESSVYRELVLVKVAADDKTRAAINDIVDIFRAKIIDIAPKSLTIEITGDEPKIQAFIDLMKPYGIIEMARTGLTALQRGDLSITNNNNN
ncbi:MAG: acetolactate synthase small subunit [Firmicutes bacterium]|nr:acetolactate synthase small subunit [Bacillota bacterium]